MPAKGVLQFRLRSSYWAWYWKVTVFCHGCAWALPLVSGQQLWQALADKLGGPLGFVFILVSVQIIALPLTLIPFLAHKAIRLRRLPMVSIHTLLHQAVEAHKVLVDEFGRETVYDDRARHSLRRIAKYILGGQPSLCQSDPVFLDPVPEHLRRNVLHFQEQCLARLDDQSLPDDHAIVRARELAAAAVHLLQRVDDYLEYNE